jgi:hypothetical protein
VRHLAVALCLAVPCAAARAEEPPAPAPPTSGVWPAPAPAPAPSPPAAPPVPHSARPWALSLEAGFGAGTASIPVQLLDGGSDTLDAGGGARITLGVRALRLAGGRLETRASLGATAGPPRVALGLSAPTSWLSLDAEVTEELRLGPITLGAGWFQRLGIDARSDEVVPERWSGRPCWVAHLEHASDVPAFTLAVGLRVAQERLVSGSGGTVSGQVIGLYVSFAADPLAPAPAPPPPEP